MEQIKNQMGSKREINAIELSELVKKEIEADAQNIDKILELADGLFSKDTIKRFAYIKDYKPRPAVLLAIAVTMQEYAEQEEEQGESIEGELIIIEPKNKVA